jgi:hypothetical protein
MEFLIKLALKLLNNKPILSNYYNIVNIDRSGTRDYSKMLATPRGAKAAANWLQRTNLLPQFSLGL